MDDQTLNVPLNGLRDEVITLKSQFGSLDLRFTKIESQLTTLVQGQSEREKPNWSLILGFLSFAVLLIGGSWTLVGLRTDNTIGPVASLLSALSHDIETLKSVASNTSNTLSLVTAQNATSITDRADMNRSISELKNISSVMNAQQRGDESAWQAKLTEIETQFSAADEVRNIQFANQMRWNSIFFEKANPGVRFPDAIEYYPHISQHNRQTQ